MSKIISLSQLPAVLKEARQKDRRLVLATGVFDLLHAEHQKFLQAASEQGDVFLVGIETDRRVRKLKGRGRPVWNLTKRLKSLAQLEEIDFVFPLPDKFDNLADYEQFMALVRPDVLAVSSHSPFQKIKRELTEKYGGKLKIVLPHNPIISTTKMMQEFKKDLRTVKTLDKR
ncbi:hypothetical protein A2160_00895 [Candidatus Beckwithbacteria bacterium RBG_13_42_9]|uniref:Cytidyltransferase-like domain-containing protein n=1 Tax=Candidatus Beckwithbacteria bacterium RBG_13_42_9 TaxID=1797457 RepID=A0A1F5E3F8_9BACT|nr:MAG: hypothetical protein A2160_00895 [Candidatus Beckwithbacteria bacterium RBG_13_42_9]